MAGEGPLRDPARSGASGRPGNQTRIWLTPLISLSRRMTSDENSSAIMHGCPFTCRALAWQRMLPGSNWRKDFRSRATADSTTSCLMAPPTGFMFRMGRRWMFLTLLPERCWERLKTRRAYTASPSFPNLHRGFTTNGKNATVSVFDTNTFKTLKNIPVADDPDFILYDRARQTRPGLPRRCGRHHRHRSGKGRSDRED